VATGGNWWLNGLQAIDGRGWLRGGGVLTQMLRQGGRHGRRRWKNGGGAARLGRRRGKEGVERWGPHVGDRSEKVTSVKGYNIA
jgi:hypothetical protein